MKKPFMKACLALSSQIKKVLRGNSRIKKIFFLEKKMQNLQVNDYYLQIDIVLDSSTLYSGWMIRSLRLYQ